MGNDTEVRDSGDKLRLSKILLNLFNVLLLLLILFMFFITIINRGENGVQIGSYRFLTVITGSMEPVIPTGSFIVTSVVSKDEVAIGDIITYRPLENYNTLVTHRVIKMNNDATEFITQGDANNIEDSGSVKFDSIIGRVAVIIPGLGMFLAFLRTPVGIFFLVALFLFLVVLGELLKRFTQK